MPVFFPPYCLHSEPQARLDPSCWPSHTGLCELSGLVTLRLMVEDTDGNLYCDTQRLWIDNKPICAKVRIDAVPKCQDLFVSQFANPPECSAAWNLPLSGIAYDAYINDALPLTRPNGVVFVRVASAGRNGGGQLPDPGTPGDALVGRRDGSLTWRLMAAKSPVRRFEEKNEESQQ